MGPHFWLATIADGLVGTEAELQPEPLIPERSESVRSSLAGPRQFSRRSPAYHVLLTPSLHQLCDEFLDRVRWNAQIAESQRAALVQHRLTLLERRLAPFLKEFADGNHVPP